MRRLAAGLICVGLMASAGPARPATLSAETTDRGCATSVGGEGTDSAAFDSPGRGFVTAELHGGPRGDWELAAFRHGEPIGASTALGSNERLDLYLTRGQRVVFQACRTDRGPRAVRLETSFARFTPEPAEPVSLARVSIA